MYKAGNVLIPFSPKLIQVTCLAYGFHWVAETMRSNYSDVDQLLIAVLKCRELYPDLNLSPEPILRRWCTWLEAPLYYCEHFEKIKISNQNTETATAIDNYKIDLHKNPAPNNMQPSIKLLKCVSVSDQELVIIYL